MKLVVQDVQAWLPKLTNASLSFLLPTKHKIFFLCNCFKIYILKKKEDKKEEKKRDIITSHGLFQYLKT